ncbi:MAG: non-canonical purine NTP pyrophosphatase, partial [Acidimicrobiales bacterium]
ATLVDNARLKAAAVVEATGLPAIADDTGLFVEGLGGQPGVRSARYAGEGCTAADNVEKLLTSLSGEAAGSGRAARFVTVALARWPDGRELVAEGVVLGEIAPSVRGEGGFGYDPVFIPKGSGGRTYAEMGPVEKNDISHRSRAFRALAEMLVPRESGS